jgi:putative membrane protein
MRRLPFGPDSGLERVGSLAIIGLILVPLVVGGLLIWALWKPTGNLDRVTAAVVNDDVAVTVNGKTVPLGREFAGALINNSGGTASAKTGANAPSSNFTWVLTNDSDAAEGLSSGRYSAVVTIPAGFSEAATSLSGPAEDAHQATINVATSPDSAFLDPALTQAVTSAATESLNQELTAQYLTNIYLGFNTINAQIGQAASGASSLASGASSVSSGAQSLVTGNAALSTALQALSSGASTLSSGLDSLSSQSSTLPDQTAALASGSTALASTAANAASSVNDATTSFEAIVAQICQTPGPQCTTATAALKKLQAANSGVAQFSAGAAQVASGNQQLAAGMPGLVGSISQRAALTRSRRERPSRRAVQPRSPPARRPSRPQPVR